MNPSRLAELNHQRALVREQLEWLEREIARESSGSTPTQITPSPAPALAPTKPTEPVYVSAQVDAYQPDPVAAAIDTRRGCFVAIASGNTRADGNQANRLAQAAPDIDGMIAVGGVGRTLDVAFYSTTGSYVEISAPGGDQRQGGNTAGILQQTLDLDLLETYNRPVSQYGPPRADSFGYYYFQGTSMATPHVSGFAALLMQQGITSPAAIEAAMKQFATDRGPRGRDDSYGYGLINPRETLRGLGLAR